MASGLFKSGRAVVGLSFVVLCLLGGMVPAFSQSDGPPVDPVAETPDEINLIHFGDLIEVDIVGSVEYDWRGAISPEGFLLGPAALKQPVSAICRSESQVAADVAKSLSFLRNPVVTVRILDRSNRPHSALFGAVRTPQRFQIRRAVRLNELIVRGGGFTEKASGEIQIVRPASLSCAGRNQAAQKDPAGDGLQRERIVGSRQDNATQFFNIRISDLLSGKSSANPEILAGDVVTVVESLPIYVIGGVVTPRQIATRAETTVSRAIAGAGGLAKNSDPTVVTIYRRNGGNSKTITCDLTKIKSGLEEDVVLQAFDVVEVSQKGTAKRKFPPEVTIDDTAVVSSDKLPLSIVD
jgi:protein involved in polysaccharide export with SLBB domain